MSQLKPFLVRADTRVSVYNGDGYDEVMTKIVMATSTTKAEETFENWVSRLNEPYSRTYYVMSLEVEEPLYEETEEDR